MPFEGAMVASATRGLSPAEPPPFPFSSQGYSSLSASGLQEYCLHDRLSRIALDSNYSLPSMPQGEEASRTFQVTRSHRLRTPESANIVPRHGTARRPSRAFDQDSTSRLAILCRDLPHESAEDRLFKDGTYCTHCGVWHGSHVRSSAFHIYSMAA